MLTIRAMADGKGYAARHLEHSDYYAEGERVTGQWYGRAAGMLGLRGAVASHDFEAVRLGYGPSTKEFLRIRRSADRTAVDGKKLAQGRSLYDLTISAPKSVSLLAILGGDERLAEAHRAAVVEALSEIETHAVARVRRAHANENRATGNLVLAVYHHDTSRELDPQLHAHAVAANLTFDGTEGRWKALQASEIYERRAYLSEVYRNALARQVRALGYETESQRDVRGRDAGFEIKGVPADLLVRFSQRSRQRDEAIESFIVQHGRRPTDNEVAVLVRETRADKLTGISTRELRDRQHARLSPNERELLHGMRGNARATQVALDSAARSLEHAKAHVFERLSVAPDHALLTEALRHGRGRVSLAALKGELAFEESSGKVLRSGRNVATVASLEREREMIAAINAGLGSFAPLGGSRTFIASDCLRPEQKHAVEFVLGSRDRAVSISGAAGTGKTATLRELRRGLIEAGREVLAVAPTMSAVEEMQKVGFADAITLERLLQDTRVQTDAFGKVVILDEAGMVSARQMASFLKLAEAHSMRVVFSGDTRQIQSVEAGDALRILEKESRLKTVSLNQVQRQTREDYRDAIVELRRDPERGFAKLAAMGAVREVPFDERAQAVADAYDTAGGASCLVVCATHEEIDRVTEAIRERRKTRGEIGPGMELVRHVSLNWTAAQKADLRDFRPGQLLGFHRAVKAIAKNETVEVVRSGPAGVVVRKADGTDHAITSKHAASFDVLAERRIEVSAGDRLLLTRNRREAGLHVTNGELVTVAAVDTAGRVHLADGRTLPTNYRSFSHGYAVTAHRSQGKTVDSVIISADGMQRELFYVAASRGRQAVTVITSDREQLRETVAQSTARTSASELLRGKGTVLRRGACRGMAIAGEMVRRAAEFVQKVAITHKKERSYEHVIGR
jgi:conjugative relaxase-like TrwC/TraI family protein